MNPLGQDLANRTCIGLSPGHNGSFCFGTTALGAGQPWLSEGARSPAPHPSFGRPMISILWAIALFILFLIARSMKRGHSRNN
jgi:hypothetical protein